ncbi:MAG TPA: pilus assembly PilX N-terminal domain-containing protein [Candidatus Acidoferrales bacterium]|nr:pilus assembly PilX N-terminal domain-containing protein [Candidatus Acidoferrales bacterium]
MKLKSKPVSSHERGIAMIVALLALTLVAIIGVGFMFMADTENSVNNNYRDSQRAYFAARAGMEDVRYLMMPGNTLNASAMALAMPSTSGGVIYVKNPNASESAGSIDPTTQRGNTVAANPYLDTELCQEQFGGLNLHADANVACNSTSSNSPQLMSSAGYYAAPTMGTTDVPFTGSNDALLFKWVRITNKQNKMGLLGQRLDGSQGDGAQVCWTGTKEVAVSGSCGAQPSPMMPVWLLTSLAITPGVGNSPGARRMEQMEVALNPTFSVLPPGTVSAQAPITIKGSLNVNGYDNCNCTATGGNLTGKTCDTTKYAIYSGNGVTQNGNSATLTSGQTTAVKQNVNPWPYSIDDLINQYKAEATPATTTPWSVSCTGIPNLTAVPAVYSDCGTTTGQQFGIYPTGLPSLPVGSVPNVVYVPGSVQLSGNTSGSGVLIIDGDLDVHGGLNFYGLILVRGQINFTGGGSQSVNLYGAILAGEDVNAQDIASGDSIGGSFNFRYDSCALKQKPIVNIGPPKLLAEHEISF